MLLSFGCEMWYSSPSEINSPDFFAESAYYSTKPPGISIYIYVSVYLFMFLFIYDSVKL